MDKQCHIRTLNQHDYELVVNLWRDPQVRQHLGGIVDSDRVIQLFKEMLSANGKQRYLVVSFESAKIGLVSIDDSREPGEMELSYQFLSAFWGRGLAYQALKDCLVYAEQEMGLQRILAETQLKNMRSRKLLEKLGFVAIKQLERFGEMQGVYEYLFSKR